MSGDDSQLQSVLSLPKTRALALCVFKLHLYVFPFFIYCPM